MKYVFAEHEAGSSHARDGEDNTGADSGDGWEDATVYTYVPNPQPPQVPPPPAPGRPESFIAPSVIASSSIYSNDEPAKPHAPPAPSTIFLSTDDLVEDLIREPSPTRNSRARPMSSCQPPNHGDEHARPSSRRHSQGYHPRSHSTRWQSEQHALTVDRLREFNRAQGAIAEEEGRECADPGPSYDALGVGAGTDLPIAPGRLDRRPDPAPSVVTKWPDPVNDSSRSQDPQRVVAGNLESFLIAWRRGDPQAPRIPDASRPLMPPLFINRELRLKENQHLGNVLYTAILLNLGHGTDNYSGMLSEFFRPAHTGEVKGQAPADKSLYRPQNFDADSFLRAIKEEFKLDGQDRIRLWQTNFAGQQFKRLGSLKSLMAAIVNSEEYFVDQPDHPKRYYLAFLVELSPRQKNVIAGRSQRYSAVPVRSGARLSQEFRLPSASMDDSDTTGRGRNSRSPRQRRVRGILEQRLQELVLNNPVPKTPQGSQFPKSSQRASSTGRPPYEMAGALSVPKMEKESSSSRRMHPRSDENNKPGADQHSRPKHRKPDSAHRPPRHRHHDSEHGVPKVGCPSWKKAEKPSRIPRLSRGFKGWGKKIRKTVRQLARNGDGKPRKRSGIPRFIRLGSKHLLNRLLGRPETPPFNKGGMEKVACSLLSQSQGSSHRSPAQKEPPREGAMNTTERGGGESSAPPRHSFLMHLEPAASDRGKPDGLETILPVSQSPSEVQWADACSLLLLGPAEHTRPCVKSINVPGSNMWISPRQYWVAFLMLSARADRDICGGILADIPGSGKSHILLAAAAIKSYAMHHVADVEAEWARRSREEQRGSHHAPTRHLPKAAPAGSRCDCYKRQEQGVPCYSSPSSVTRRIFANMSRGATLIMVPPGAMSDWVKRLEAVELSPRWYTPWIFHTDTPDRFKPALGAQQLLRVTATPKTKTYAKEHDLSVSDLNYHYDCPTDIKRQPERYIMLATHFSKQFKDSFQVTVSMPTGVVTRLLKQVYGCPIGLQIVDEFHQVTDDQSFPVKLAEESKHILRGNFDFWSVTGTPTPNGLADLQSTLAILEREGWNQETHHQHRTRSAGLLDLHASHEAARGEAAPAEDQRLAEQRADAFFSGGLMIRHSERSRFLGESILSTKEVKVKRYNVWTPAEFAHSIQQISDHVMASLSSQGLLDESPQSSLVYRKLARLQMCATFPGAAKVMLDGSFDFKTESVRQVFREAKQADAAKIPFLTGLYDEVIGGGVTIMWMKMLISGLSLDKGVRPQRDAFGRLRDAGDDLGVKKLVMVTPRLAEAVFLYLYLRKEKPELRPVLYHPDLKASEKATTLARFNRLSEDSPRIFVTSFDAGGTGLNLQVASHQILTGPLQSRAAEAQCFARTNREGQQLPCSHHLMFTEDNPAHRLLLTSHLGRQLASNPFDMGMPVGLRATPADVAGAEVPPIEGGWI